MRLVLAAPALAALAALALSCRDKPKSEPAVATASSTAPVAAGVDAGLPAAPAAPADAGVSFPAMPPGPALKAARAAMKAGDYPLAIAAYRRAQAGLARESSLWPAVIAERGYAYLKAGELEAASSSLHEAREIARGEVLRAQIAYNLGSVYALQGYDNAALVEFARADAEHSTAASRAKLVGKTPCLVEHDETPLQAVLVPTWRAVWNAVERGPVPSTEAAARTGLCKWASPESDCPDKPFLVASRDPGSVPDSSGTAGSAVVPLGSRGFFVLPNVTRPTELGGFKCPMIASSESLEVEDGILHVAFEEMHCRTVMGNTPVESTWEGYGDRSNDSYWSLQDGHRLALFSQDDPDETDSLAAQQLFRPETIRVHVAAGQATFEVKGCTVHTSLVASTPPVAPAP